MNMTLDGHNYKFAMAPGQMYLGFPIKSMTLDGLTLTVING